MPIGDMTVKDDDNGLLSIVHDLIMWPLPAFENPKTGILYPLV